MGNGGSFCADAASVSVKESNLRHVAASSSTAAAHRRMHFGPSHTEPYRRTAAAAAKTTTKTRTSAAKHQEGERMRGHANKNLKSASMTSTASDDISNNGSAAPPPRSSLSLGVMIHHSLSSPSTQPPLTSPSQPHISIATSTTTTHNSAVYAGSLYQFGASPIGIAVASSSVHEPDDITSSAAAAHLAEERDSVTDSDKEENEIVKSCPPANPSVVPHISAASPPMNVPMATPAALPTVVDASRTSEGKIEAMLGIPATLTGLHGRPLPLPISTDEQDSHAAGVSNSTIANGRHHQHPVGQERPFSRMANRDSSSSSSGEDGSHGTGSAGDGGGGASGEESSMSASKWATSFGYTLGEHCNNKIMIHTPGSAAIADVVSTITATSTKPTQEASPHAQPHHAHRQHPRHSQAKHHPFHRKPLNIMITSDDEKPPRGDDGEDSARRYLTYIVYSVDREPVVSYMKRPEPPLPGKQTSYYDIMNLIFPMHNYTKSPIVAVLPDGGVVTDPVQTYIANDVTVLQFRIL